LNILTVDVETVSYSKFVQGRKENYERVGVEFIVILLAKLLVDLKKGEKALGEWVWVVVDGCSPWL